MTLQESADHWNQLADDELRGAEYEEGRGHYGGVHRNRAEMFRKTARSLELQVETGKPHCTACLHVVHMHGDGPARALLISDQYFSSSSV